MSGGRVGLLDAAGHSQVDITGGVVEELVVGWQSQVDISGGQIGGGPFGIFADESSLIVLNGFDFNYGYGYITDTFGIITGTLLSGEIINTSFERFGDAQILLVPEPMTLSLLAFGGLVLLRKRK